jgi:hypothetical protein
MARQTKDVDPPREVEVLHDDGRWLHGWLRAYQRDGDGWRGLVDYRDPETLGHWLQWRDGAELRRPVSTTHGLGPVRS